MPTVRSNGQETCVEKRSKLLFMSRDYLKHLSLTGLHNIIRRDGKNSSFFESKCRSMLQINAE